jgi:hypothetical protein
MLLFRSHTQGCPGKILRQKEGNRLPRFVLAGLDPAIYAFGRPKQRRGCADQVRARRLKMVSCESQASNPCRNNLPDSPAATRDGPPQKGPSFGLRSRQLDFGFRRDGVMGLFLVLFWCSAVAGGILRFNSRFGVFSSRFGRRQFPFSPATGIGGQGLDLVRCFRHQNGRYRGKSPKFPVPREKPGISPPPTEGAVETSASPRLSPARAATTPRVHRRPTRPGRARRLEGVAVPRRRSR